MSKTHLVPVIADVDEIKTMVDSDRRLTTRKIGQALFRRIYDSLELCIYIYILCEYIYIYI